MMSLCSLDPSPSQDHYRGAQINEDGTVMMHTLKNTSLQ
jgi:hypothetical protein